MLSGMSDNDLAIEAQDRSAAVRIAAVAAGFAAVETLVAGARTSGDVGMLNEAARLLDALGPAWPPAGEDMSPFRAAYVALAEAAAELAQVTAQLGVANVDLFRIIVKYCP